MVTSFLLVVKCLMGAKGISTHMRFVFPVQMRARERRITLLNNSTKESNDSV